MSSSIQYTIRNIPPSVDSKLKAQAKKQGISLNKLVLAKLGAPQLKPSQGRTKIYKDLNWMRKIMPLDEARAIDQAIEQARQADKAQAYARYQAEKENGQWKTD